MKSKNGEPELISLLQYMKQSNLNNPDIMVQDERIVKLDTIVNEVKQSEEWEVVNMSIYGKGIERGREEGVQQGWQQSFQLIALEMLRDGEPLEKIMKYTKLTEEEIKTLEETCKRS
ncbi:MAG: hypothetical protein QM657_15025 [Lacrimispora sp.]|uniref:hypothetical protein n=1 Tax=Lacrimispora sp. TaxID=2719234 RepID=UPI0039E4CCAF